jgi:hypothetical protein
MIPRRGKDGKHMHQSAAPAFVTRDRLSLDRGPFVAPATVVNATIWLVYQRLLCFAQRNQSGDFPGILAPETVYSSPFDPVAF